MPRQIAIFGGSFNPPGLHHRLIAEQLEPEFDEVLVVPCGPRPDKPTTNDVDPVHRATLTDIAFRDLAKTRVELFDLEQATFTRTDELDARFSGHGELWHVVGTDFTTGGGQGQSVIQTKWEGGADMWNSLNFLVVARRGIPAKPEDLPPRSRVIQMDSPQDDASSTIREKIFKREPYAQLMLPEVASYIERYGLYRGRIPSRTTLLDLSEPRVLIYADETNERARAWTEKLRPWENAEQPNCIVAVGGDGTMLQAIRRHWRRRIPFLGLNAGHLGFLLNNPESLFNHTFSPGELVARQMPMLYVEIEKECGATESTLAFNDAWVERATSQSAWLEISVNDRVRIRKLVGDGVLVSTAAGSTAYARSMGCQPLLADTPGWLIVGSNVLSPPKWKSALLSTETNIRVLNLSEDKRPVDAFVDGRAHGRVRTLDARLSRIAAPELAFCAEHDTAEKIALIQFPSSDG